MRLRLFVGAALLLLVILGVNSVLLFSSLNETYINAALSPYDLVSAKTARALEDRLTSNKGLGTLSEIAEHVDRGMRDLRSLAAEEYLSLREVEPSYRKALPEASVSLMLPNGAVLYTTNPSFGEGSRPSTVAKEFWRVWNDDFNLIEMPYTLVWRSDMNFVKLQRLKLDPVYFIGMPVRDTEGTPLALLVMGVPQQYVTSSPGVLVSDNWAAICAILLTSVVSMVLALQGLIGGRRRVPGRFKTKFVILVATVAGVSQIVLSGFMLKSFGDDYIESSRAKADLVLSDFNAQITETSGGAARMAALLAQAVDTMPELMTISVYGDGDRKISSAAQEVTRRTSSELGVSWLWLRDAIFPGSHYQVRAAISTAGVHDGTVVAEVSDYMIRDQRFQSVLDGLISAVLGALIFIELLILVLKYLERYTARRTKTEHQFHYGVMRPAMFLFLFGIDTSLSFLPLHMANLYEPFLGLSRDLVMGLPISVEFFFVGLAILTAGSWLDRRGWYEPFLCGLMIATMGGIYSWLALGPGHFIAARGVVGVGYGLALMAAQGFVVRYSDKKSKAQALAQIFAGLYAGSICGAGAGGMLAERIGFGPVFLIGALVLLMAVVYTILLMRESFVLPTPAAPAAKPKKGKRGPLLKFILDRRILSLVLFSSLPASIAVVGFLHYFSPIYLHRLGMSQSTIGQIIVVYGLCLIFAGPGIGRLVDRSHEKKSHILFGGLLGAAAFLIFPVLDGIWAAIVALGLLGLSSSFVLSAQSAYALRLRVTKEYGDGKALGVFRATSRIGQVLGPILFASVITVAHIQEVITYVGVAYAMAALLFVIFVYKSKKVALVEVAR